MLYVRTYVCMWVESNNVFVKFTQLSRRSDFQEECDGIKRLRGAHTEKNDDGKSREKRGNMT